MPYQPIDHTADLAIRVRADSLDGLFADAAFGMFSLIVDPMPVRGTRKLAIRVDADDWEELMVAWLRELLYLWNAKQIGLCAITDMAVTPYAVHAAVRVDTVHPRSHHVLNEIKAVTYHQIEVLSDTGGWTARVVFDA